MIIGKDTRLFLKNNPSFQAFWKVINRVISPKTEWCLFLIQEENLDLLSLGMSAASVKVANKIAQLVVDKCPQEPSKFFITFPIEAEEILNLLRVDTMENRIKLVRGENADL